MPDLAIVGATVAVDALRPEFVLETTRLLSLPDVRVRVDTEFGEKFGVTPGFKFVRILLFIAGYIVSYAVGLTKFDKEADRAVAASATIAERAVAASAVPVTRGSKQTKKVRNLVISCIVETSPTLGKKKIHFGFAFLKKIVIIAFVIGA
ncbi:MAG: hypothetical protein LBF37_03945 [Rickettsiales bacterium]|nr:hypothetical protein [Rickettsiales bacterium]